MTRTVTLLSLALVLAATGLAVLPACSSSLAQKQTDALLESSQGFQEGVRWGRYEDAAAHVPPAERDKFLDERDELAEELKIDDYEVLRVHVKKGHKRARVQVKYTWHLDSVGTVHETVTEQDWVRHNKIWWMEGEVRKRGKKMPGLAEAPKKAPPGPASPSAGDPAGDPEAPAGGKARDGARL